MTGFDVAPEIEKDPAPIQYCYGDVWVPGRWLHRFSYTMAYTLMGVVREPGRGRNHEAAFRCAFCF